MTSSSTVTTTTFVSHLPWYKIQSLTLLDLELYHKNHTIYAKNYSKLTAGNSFLHYQNCHLPQWINNILKRQLCCIRHNCTRDEDYITQSVQLTHKCLEKGYPQPLLEQAFLLYRAIPLRPGTAQKRDIGPGLSPDIMVNIDKWNTS